MLAVGLKTLYNRLKVLRGRIGPAAAEGSPPGSIQLSPRGERKRRH